MKESYISAMDYSFLKVRRDVKWYVDPFPYAVIDDFLPLEIFQKLRGALDEARQKINLQVKFNTDAESKEVFTDKNLPSEALQLIEIMGSEDFKKILSEYCHIKREKIISMLDTPGYSGLSPFHISQKGDFLGAHVDHSVLQYTDLVHFANTIYYCSDDWHESWGGQTLLFSSYGTTIKTLIEPKPNRLLIFIHSSTSFHGASKYYGPVERRTFYHDYYVKKSEMGELAKALKSSFKVNFRHVEHSTTFLPYIPFGLSSFKVSSILSRRNIIYLYYYFIYIIKRGIMKASSSCRN
jgi:hypothetical protein